MEERRQSEKDKREENIKNSARLLKALAYRSSEITHALVTNFNLTEAEAKTYL
jgi:hypothetical protein